MKRLILIGAILGFIAVALGAFGAHGLEGRVSEHALDNWDKAVLYQMFHAAAILVVGILLAQFNEMKIFKWSAWFFLIGVILFSGSLYSYTLTGALAFAMITPFGGVAFLIGWVCLAIGAMRLDKNS